MAETLPRMLEKEELFALLERGHFPSVCVVTPNRRLARALVAEFDLYQAGRGRLAWEAADILPLPSLVERMYEEACCAEGPAALPNLLSPDQERALWERQIRRSRYGHNLLAVSETAVLASEAWSLAHAWLLMPAFAAAALDEDSAAFSDWAERYVRQTKRDGLTERARLPQVIEGALELKGVRKPSLLVQWGFDILTPQQHALMRALAALGVELARGQAGLQNRSAALLACADADEELRLAARWARARFEEARRTARTAGAQNTRPDSSFNGDAAIPFPRIGVVIPDLAMRRNAVRRTFREILAPDRGQPGDDARSLPYNVSLGERLASIPLVRHALEVLSLGGPGIQFDRVSRVLRSPFLAGGESEDAERGELDAALRRHARPELSLDALLTLVRRKDVPRAPLLVHKLEAYAEFRRGRLFAAQTTRAWGITFSDALKLVGFPGERTLDSTEYQVLAKWHEILAEFAQLDLVLPEIGFQEALGRLQRMASVSEFQPETAAAPIQVLGVLEAAGMEFDHLWVCGLTDGAWPLHPGANPLIPFAAQRAAGVPNASPSETLALARRLTAGWLTASGETVLSHALREADRNLQPSALIASVAKATVAPPDYATWRDRIRSHGSTRLLTAIDDSAPPPGSRSAPGAGISVLKNQAACPFRAFARHRLAAQAMHQPHPGLDPMERGTLVHAAIAAAWREIQTQSRLAALSEAELNAIVSHAAQDALDRGPGYGAPELRGRFGRIEHERLTRLARSWLEYERGARAGLPGYRIAELETRHEVEIGGLMLSVRLDRVDETGDGERIVIDYKTGAATLPSILRERLDEPQLPLYLNSVEQGAGAVAFAQIRADGMKFVGLGRSEGLLPGVSTPEKAATRSGAQADWPAQRLFWKNELEQLARGYLVGRAEVDPKRPGATCRECDLHVLCRITQRGITQRGELAGVSD